MRTPQNSKGLKLNHGIKCGFRIQQWHEKKCKATWIIKKKERNKWRINWPNIVKIEWRLVVFFIANQIKNIVFFFHRYDIYVGHIFIWTLNGVILYKNGFFCRIFICSIKFNGTLIGFFFCLLFVWFAAVSSIFLFYFFINISMDPNRINKEK